jgi:hypothetical protein
MATWPAGTKASTDNLDAGTDSPSTARADILQNVQNVNAIVDMFNISSPQDNQILKYNTSNSRFELAASTGETLTIVGDDSTGTAITLGETFKIAGSGGVTTAVSGDTLTVTGPDLSTYLENLIEDTTPQLGGNLDLNSNDITGTGNISITGDISTDAISIADNKITTTRSNDILKLQASGTGDIYIGNVEAGSLSFSGAFASNSGPQMAYITDTASTRLNSTNIYPNARTAEIVLNADVTTGNRARMTDAVDLDLNGYSWSSSSFGAGPAQGKFTTVRNSQATTEALGTAQAMTFGLVFPEGANAGSTINVTHAFGSRIINQFSTGSNDTVNVTNLYGHYYQPTFSFNNDGTATVTNDYAFYVANPGASGSAAITPTNRYAFYSSSDTAKSRVGTLERYREKINTLTSSSTITVDCGLAPVHTVTLTNSTGFVISNLSTGQSVMLIITQDGTGSRTATFGTDTSTAVKFPGGTPALSTDGGYIDVVTVFNDGTNFIGNIARNYS